MLDREGMRLWWLRAGFSLKKRIGLYERLEAFLDAGIDIVAAMTSIRDRYARHKRWTGGRGDARAKILDEWISTMARGNRFETAVKEWVPASEHMLISSGERGVGLIHGLHEACVMSMAAARTKAAIIAGTLYPVALFGMLIFQLVLFQTKMVPVYTKLKPVVAWPSSAQDLYYISYFVYHYLAFILIGLVLLAFIITTTLGRWVGPIRNFFDKLPPWSIYRGYQASSFMIGLASMMKAGVAHYDALRMMHRSASAWMRAHLDRMMAAMRLGGDNPGAAMDTGLLDQETAGDVQDYSRLGNFREAIYKLGSRALEAGVKQVEGRMAIIRNILLVCVVGVVGWIYMTTYLLNGNIASSQGTQMNQPAIR